MRKPREPRLTARMGVVVWAKARAVESRVPSPPREMTSTGSWAARSQRAMASSVEAEVGGAVGLKDGGEAVAGEPVEELGEDELELRLLRLGDDGYLGHGEMSVPRGGAASDAAGGSCA